MNKKFALAIAFLGILVAGTQGTTAFADSAANEAVVADSFENVELVDSFDGIIEDNRVAEPTPAPVATPAEQPVAEPVEVVQPAAPATTPVNNTPAAPMQNAEVAISAPTTSDATPAETPAVVEVAKDDTPATAETSETRAPLANCGKKAVDTKEVKVTKKTVKKASVKEEKSQSSIPFLAVIGMAIVSIVFLIKGKKQA